MSDFGGVPTSNYTPPDGLATLGSLMSLKSKQLQIQGQQQGLQGQAADVQMTQQDAAQRKGLANVDWDKHLDANGLLDTGSFAKDPAIRKAAGDQYPDLLAKANQVRQGQIQNQQSLLGLNKDQIGAVGSMVDGLRTDPDVVADNAAGRQKVTNAFTQAGQVYGPGVAKVAATYGPMVQHAPPGKLPSALQALALQTESAGKQIEMTSPQGPMVTGPGGNLKVVNTNPNASQPVGSQVGQGAGQGIAPQLTALPTGQVGAVAPGGGSVSPLGAAPAAPAASGPAGAPSQSAGPRSAQDDAPGANAPRAVQENYQRAAAEAQEHVSNVRKADSEYGNNVSISNTIRHLSDSTTTGPGTDTWHRAMAGLGVDGGADYQELGAFLDRQAAGLRTQMGLPGTNAGAEESKAISGNTEYARKALQDKNDYTQSLVEGAHQYRHGLDRVAGFGGQASPKAVQQFRSEWADNFDPNVYKLDIMKRQGPDKLKAFVSSLDPKEAASLAVKRKNLQTLSNGQLPQ